MFNLVSTGRARGRACGLGTGHAMQGETSQELGPEPHPKVAPCSHVLWFVLDPVDRGAVCVAVESRLEVPVGERVELLEADDRNIVALAFVPRLFELVIHLTRTHENPVGGL